MVPITAYRFASASHWLQVLRHLLKSLSLLAQAVLRQAVFILVAQPKVGKNFG